MILVATERNMAYGLDAYNGSIIWSRQYGKPFDPSTVPTSVEGFVNCNNIVPVIGVTGTPVIDETTSTFYVVNKEYTCTTCSTTRYWMHAHDTKTGVERPGFPVLLEGNAQNGGRAFDSKFHLQRPGLLLMGGVVYVAFGSHCDSAPWQGWIFGVTTQGVIRTIFTTLPDTACPWGCSMWMAGGGLTSDGPGQILFSVGNINQACMPTDWISNIQTKANMPNFMAQGIVRTQVQADGSLKMVDFFIPYNAFGKGAGTTSNLNTAWSDVGVNGVSIADGFGSTKLALFCSKESYFYALNKDDLGGYNPTDSTESRIVGRFVQSSGAKFYRSYPTVSVFGPTSNGQGYFYMSGHTAPLHAFTNTTTAAGKFTLAVAGTSSTTMFWGTGQAIITSNGNDVDSGVVWVSRFATQAQGAGASLIAYRALPTATGSLQVLYSYGMTGMQWNNPIPYNGRIYVPEDSGISCHAGPNAPPPINTTPTPTFDPLAPTPTKPPTGTPTPLPSPSPTPIAQPGELDPYAIPQFVNTLPNPLAPANVFTASATDTYVVAVKQGFVNILGAGFNSTKIFGYANSADPSQSAPTYPGRTFNLQSFRTTRVTWQNNLTSVQHFLPIDRTVMWANPLNEASTLTTPYTGPVPIVVHVHGVAADECSDGGGRAWYTPNYAITGPDYCTGVRQSVYPNAQEAGNPWYHDHAHGITRLNVYAGLAGFWLLRDSQDTGLASNPLGLPAYPYEIPLLIQDRRFTLGHQLFYPSDPPTASSPAVSIRHDFVGRVMVTNGKAWPVQSVERRKYRFRIINGCDTRVLGLYVTGGSIVQIGTDGGFLSAVATFTATNTLKIAPGERADIIIDFTQWAFGASVTLMNSYPLTDGSLPLPSLDGTILRFTITTALSAVADNAIRTTTYRSSSFSSVQTPLQTRPLGLYEQTDDFGRRIMKMGTGTQAYGFLDPTTEIIAANTTEIWEITNHGTAPHPIHLHLAQLEVLGRYSLFGTGDLIAPEANELGPKDTVLATPQSVTRFKAAFPAAHLGDFMWHCHALAHEDYDMMRKLKVVAGSDISLALLPTPLPSAAPTPTLGPGYIAVEQIGAAFFPRSITIPLGTTVRWYLDPLAHNVARMPSATSCIPITTLPNEDPASFYKDFDGADTYDITFTTTGVYHYACEPHCLNDMRGNITVITPTATPAPTLSYRGLFIDVGSTTSLADSQGVTWVADVGYRGTGTAGTATVTIPVTGDVPPGGANLFATHAFGPSVTYTIPVPAANTAYTVTIYSCENNAANIVGSRVFSIAVMGTTRQTGIDLLALTGGLWRIRAFSYVANVGATPSITVTLTGTTGNGILQAISVVASTAPTATVGPIATPAPPTLRPSTAPSTLPTVSALPSTLPTVSALPSTLPTVTNSHCWANATPAPPTLRPSTAPSTLPTVSALPSTLPTVSALAGPSMTPPRPTSSLGPTPQFAGLFIDAGSATTSVIDGAGRTWISDVPYRVLGTVGVPSTTTYPVTGELPPGDNAVVRNLFMNQLFGTTVSYNVPVPPGQYIVTLFLIENVLTNNAPGMRVISVALQGTVRQSGIDLYALTGGFFIVKQFYYSVTVTAASPAISLVVTKSATAPGNAIVHAFSITSGFPYPTPLPPLTPTPGPFALYIDSGSSVGIFDGVRTWVPDGSYIDPASSVLSTSVNLATSPFIGQIPSGGVSLFFSNLWATDLRYAIPVPAAGTYRVTLYIMENFYTLPNLRVQNITVQGVVRVPRLDLIQSFNVMFNVTAFTYSVAITDANKVITIRLQAMVNFAIIQALSVVQIGDANGLFAEGTTKEITGVATLSAGSGAQWNYLYLLFAVAAFAGIAGFVYVRHRKSQRRSAGVPDIEGRRLDVQLRRLDDVQFDDVIVNAEGETVESRSRRNQTFQVVL
eukprot:CAMPEP_0184671628 /NCGR_PEP_ID=MMETSP0308-20130426/85618_1 /TAXON_ID=38269 /ORGANISM="Gloeochaete witrockiana, Strain SAG 46.84" /LENGTH=1900 /DNA_ID=CAMNT_0027118799 /DNA_START=270 /DNA_END=5973 /DNA_ORIENTATION=+